MRLSVIFSVLNNFDLFQTAIDLANVNSETDLDFVVIDNGSDEPLVVKEKVNLFRKEENIGNYPVFEEVLKHNLAAGDILAFFHTDLFIYEKGWDKRVIEGFEKNPKLGLIGFIGSNEIDNLGGRGLGTMSNFQGRQVGKWKGSPAEVHGKRINDLRKAVLVDGCSMIFRKKCLEEIGFLSNFPPHHFYDRLMCCQAREKGWEIGVLGIECDHFSGMTVNREPKYHTLAEKWMKERWGSIDNWIEKNKDWFNNPQNPNYQKRPAQADQWVYLEAERQFLQEYRDKKHLIPVKEL